MSTGFNRPWRDTFKRRPAALHLDARLPQLVKHSVQMVRPRAANGHLPVRRRRRHGKRRRFDPVRDDFMFGPVQTFYAGNGNGRAASPATLSRPWR